jgi:hypothetical protein
MLASAGVLIAVWGLPLLAALIDASTPSRLETYVTFVTYAIDLGIIMPAAITAGLLLLRHRAEGYVIACGLLVLEVLLAPLIMLQTASQLRAGEEFSTAEVVGPIGGFVVLAAGASVALFWIRRAARTWRET